MERSRRELARLLGTDPGPLPARGGLRDAWIDELRVRIEESGDG